MDLNLAVMQMKSGEDVKKNLEQILDLWSSLKNKENINGLCLPENSLYNKVKNSSAGLNINDPAIVRLQKLAVDNKIFINLGALPFKESHSITNATLMITPDGKVEPVYRKIHLFDLDMGSLIIRESDQFTAGSEPSIIELSNWKMAFSICYDVRFSELFLKYAKQGAEIIYVPSAFTRATGRAHWETLIRARAIECQCYVVAAGQTGVVEVEGQTRASYGHTMVVDPWGKVLIDMASDEPGIATVSLSKSLLTKIRKQMPIANHRRI